MVVHLVSQYDWPQNGGQQKHPLLRGHQVHDHGSDGRNPQRAEGEKDAHQSDGKGVFLVQFSSVQDFFIFFYLLKYFLGDQSAFPAKAGQK